MIEIVENTIQLLMSGICAGVSLYRAAIQKNREWSLLGLFSGTYFLGVLYWVMFLFLYGHAPDYSYIPDLSWYSSYLFLMLLIIYVRENSSDADAFPLKPDAGVARIARTIRPVCWFIPVFTIGMSIFFMRFGGYLSNIIAAVMMTGIIWHALSGFLSLKDRPISQSGNKALYAVTLLFCATEYALWLSSCIWYRGMISNPYFWLDNLLSLTFLMFIPALRKAVE